MRYRTFPFGTAVPDLIIDGEETYIKVHESTKDEVWTGLWPGIAYEKLEVVRAKGYDPNRSAKPNPGGRSGRPSQWASNRRTGSGYHFHTSDESVEYTPNPVSDGEAIHRLLEKWFGDERGMNGPGRKWPGVV